VNGKDTARSGGDAARMTPSTSAPPATTPERDRLADVRAGDRWLVIVAHPDDESFGLGSVIARAAVRGAEVTVACATRGEAGAIHPDGTDHGDLGAVRESELHRAAARLGAARVDLLGYRDSGFDGPPAAGSLCAVPLAGVVDLVHRLITGVRPDVVVTLDGCDGHRDHLRVRAATHEAVRRLGGVAPPLYEHTLPRSLMHRWLEETGAARGEDVYHALDAAAFGRPEEEITDVVDASDVLDRREAAIAEHRSQSSPFAGLSDDLRRAFLTADHLVRVRFPQPDDTPQETR
jgi:LmbE family N-acetylglucosaminyl deacetylase